MNTSQTQQRVDTRRAERRDLRLDSFDDLSSELDRIEAAHNAGTLRATGNWSPGQVLQHCAILMRCAIDGFPGRAPFFIRIPITLLFKRKAVSGEAPPPGLKLPKAASFLLPGDGVSVEQGLGALREQIGRIESGARFSKPSPVFGSMSHEEWTRLHLGHCRLHLGFLHPE